MWSIAILERANIALIMFAEKSYASSTGIL
jgi:hypothetical protein